MITLEKFFKSCLACFRFLALLFLTLALIHSSLQTLSYSRFFYNYFPFFLLLPLILLFINTLFYYLPSCFYSYSLLSLVLAYPQAYDLSPLALSLILAPPLLLLILLSFLPALFSLTPFCSFTLYFSPCPLAILLLYKTTQ